MEEKVPKRLRGKAVFKHETEADWLKSNYVPEDGEMVLYDEDKDHKQKRIKYGNGKDKVKDLPFAQAEESEWDFVIDKIENFTTENLANMYGNVLVKNINTEYEGIEVNIPRHVNIIQFIGCDMTNTAIRGYSSTKITGLKASSGMRYSEWCNLHGFGAVEDCHSYYLGLYGCTNISNCKFWEASNCKYISDCTIDTWDMLQDTYQLITFTNCDMINNIIIYDNSDPNYSSFTIDFENCRHISNVHGPLGTVINYKNCIYVDGDTCDGYYTAEDEGKLQVITNDGTFETFPLEKGEGESSIQFINTPTEDAILIPSKAISRNAIALGDGTTAGCKAYPITTFEYNYFEVDDPTTLSEELISSGGSLVTSIAYVDGDTTYDELSYLWWNIINIESIKDNKVYYSFKKPIPKDITVVSYDYVVFFEHPELGSQDYGENAASEGTTTRAFGYASHTEGSDTRGIGNESHAEGCRTFATTYAHAEGTSTKAYGRTSHAEGKGVSVHGFAAHGEGQGVKVYGTASHGEGSRTIAGDPKNSDFLYNHSLTSPVAAHSEGIDTHALSKGSHTGGKDTVAGRRAYRITSMEQLILNNNTRLYLNTVTGLQSGQTVTVIGNGIATAIISAVSDPSGGYTRVELDRDILSEVSKNVVDFDTETYTDYNYMIVHDELDLGDIVVGNLSAAQGLGTIATCEAQSVQGRYNTIDNTNSFAHIVGGGTSDTDRRNIYTLDWDGNANFAGDVYSGNKKLSTEEYVENKISEIPQPDFSGYATEEYVDNAIYKPEEHMQLVTTGDVVAFDITPNTTGRITITFNSCYFRYNGKRYSIQKNANGTYVSCTSGLTATTQMLVAKIGSSLNLYSADLAFRDVTKYVLAENEVILMVIAQTKNEASLCYPANLSTKVKYSVNGKVCGYQVIEDTVAKYDTVYVSTSGNDSNNGSTSSLAFKTIGAALKTDAETIIIAPGTYIERFNAATARNNLTIKVAHVARADDETLEEWKDRDTVIITAKNANGTFISQSVKYLTAFRNISNLVLEDIIFQETDVGSLCSIINCANFTIRNCQFVAAHDGHGLAINNSSGDVISCVAKYAGKDINGTIMSTATVHRDGFNIHTAGSVNIIDCIGAYNLDDGVSHHDATTGAVRGGEFHHNGKGGVASPTYGAKVDIHNVYCHDNEYGIYAVTDSDNLQSKIINISNCIIENNDVGLRADYYTIYSYSNVFKNNNTEISNTGSTIITTEPEQPGSNVVTEWDYIITKTEDFTTEKLATMSGNVLVKGIRIEDYIEKTDDYSRKLIVTVPESIKVLKFLDCSLFINLMSSTCEYTSDEYGDIYNLNVTAPQDTKIIGFTGTDAIYGVWADVYGFNAVEFTGGWVSLHYCNNIRHCSICRANHCNNLFDIICEASNWDGQYIEFDHCTMINGVNAYEDFYYEVEFVNCRHISNVHKIPTPEEIEVTITYTNCSSVNGDTCDDYYTEEDNGKVSVITTDGTKQVIDIEAMLGNLSTILTALHEGGIE